MMERATGRMKFFNGGRGFGFLVGADGKQWFAHITDMDITNHNVVPVKDDRCEFTPDTDREGRRRARRIVVLGARP